MIAVDTNVLVRALTDDPDDQAQSQLAIQLIQSAGIVFVPQIVQIEFFWVLERAYKLPKDGLIQALETLLHDEAYMLQRESCYLDALQRYKTGNAGFADAVIAVESERENTELWTFDRKLSKQTNVIRLTEDALAVYQNE